MNARELMRPVITVRAEQTLIELAEAFEDPTVRVVAVVDDKGTLNGFLTDEDLVDALIPAYIRDDESLAGVLSGMEAEDILSRVENKQLGEVLRTTEREHEYVGPDDTLLEVLSAFAESEAPAVLVIESNQPIGVITVDQILRLVLHSKSL